MRSFCCARVALLLLVSSYASPAWALTVEVSAPPPTELGHTTALTAHVQGATGQVELRWDYGDGARSEFAAGLEQVEHEYAAPGHYPIIVVARDEAGFTSSAFVHTVHRPLLSAPSVSSTTIVYDATRGLVCNVNPDNDSVSCLNAESLEKVAEVSVYDEPSGLALAPDGSLWVIHRGDYAVAIIDLDAFEIGRGFRLPYASQPAAIVMSPLGDAAYVSLMATGKLLKLDPVSGATLAELTVGPWPRGLAVSHDGERVYVTRFISADGRGEVVKVSAHDLSLTRRYELLEDTTTQDGDQAGRGLANYLFSIALSPDGREAWVPSKKDNMSRGLRRDGLALTQDNTVRPLVSVLDLVGQREDVTGRMDLDDRNLPVHVLFSPLGDYAFVTVAGSGLVEVRDTYTRQFVTALRDPGFAPLGSVLGPKQRLFVHAELSRTVAVYDVADILSGKDQTTRKLAAVPVVASETLSPEVLRGKQVFYDSEDERMTSEGYMSCASCHFEGFEDGRVWEFSDRGEGLRNTTSLLGRRGVGHGKVHWSGNFDEIQDFEGAIRTGLGGQGFLSAEQYAKGTCAEPLGDRKAGLNADLDALSAYVTSLDAIPRSPHRKSDGTLTSEGEQGKELFLALGCDGCHGGDDFTNSAMDVRYDVGTLRESSGSRLGGPLDGIDTPTLLGVWQTAPYLHDGSAASLRDVLTVRNTSDLHGAVSSLSPVQVDLLESYLLQIDQGIPPTVLPFEEDDMPGPSPVADAGEGKVDGGVEPEPPLPEPMAPGSARPSCSLAVHRSGRPARPLEAWLMLTAAVAVAITRTRRSRRSS
jgi:DNA-binding beta-propeller fold protein YncE